MMRDKPNSWTVDFSQLPSLPSSWAWCLPTDICTVIASGSTPKPDLMYSGKGEVPFIKVYNLTNFGNLNFAVKPTFIDQATHTGLLNRSRARPGDVLINIVGPPLGKVSIIPSDYPEWNINQAIVLFRPEEGISNKYLAYALMTDSIMRRVTSLAKATAGQFNIGVGMCRTLLPVPLAPLCEQVRVVAKIEELFSELDAGVAALKRVQANLKRYQSAVLKAAVEGRLTAAWRIDHAPAESGAQLLDRIINEHRQRWEKEQLAAFAGTQKDPPKNWQAKYKVPAAPDAASLTKLPAGWCWATVEQVGDVQLGRQRSPQHHSGDHMRPYLRVANIFEDQIDLSDVLEMNFTPKEFQTYELKHGDILLNEGQSLELVGRPAMYRGELPGTCFQNTLVRFRTHNGVLPEYALIVFRAYLHLRRFQKIAKWTVNIAHLGAERFSQIEFPLPPIEEQREIVDTVEQSFAALKIAEAEVIRSLTRSARLRRSILKQAFEGRLVAQDAADEPSSAILARIRQQRITQTSVAAGEAGKLVKIPREVFMRRASIVSYTVRRLSAQRSFGRTQLEKTVHLTQSHLGVDLGFVFERYAAGPFDKSIYKLEAVAKKNGWFTTQDRPTFGVTYHPGPKIDEMCQHVPGQLGDRQASFDRLLDQIAGMNTDEAELFATAYAAWNDLLIDGRPADDAAIIAEVYDWHDEKRKFGPEVIKERLDWMRRNGYVPTGQGQRTRLVEKATKLKSCRRKMGDARA